MATLVTGGAGFVGLNLVEALLARGEEVVLFDSGALPAAAEWGFARHAARLAFVKGDVRDSAAVERAFSAKRIERVAHCAAVTSGAAREAREPFAIVAVNVQGTINVLEAARRRGAGRVVVTSSGAVYGESAYRLAQLHEDATPAVPVTLYAITKFAAERVCARLRELWPMDVVCARLGTVVGPWERDTGARDNFGTHSQLARLALKGETAVLPPREVRRDWIYARDAADGLAALLEARAPGHGLYNLGAGRDWSGCITAWCEALRSAFPEFRFRAAKEGEEPNIGYTDCDRGLMDVGRLAHDVGFRPRFGPAEAYADYLEWLKRTPDFWEKNA